MSPYYDDINRSKCRLAHLPWRDRVAKSVDVLERRREHEKKEEGKIGSVMDKARREDMIHIKSKTVNFSWQRGNKIGEEKVSFVSGSFRFLSSLSLLFRPKNSKSRILKMFLLLLFPSSISN